MITILIFAAMMANIASDSRECLGISGLPVCSSSVEELMSLDPLEAKDLLISLFFDVCVEQSPGHGMSRNTAGVKLPEPFQGANSVHEVERDQQIVDILADHPLAKNDDLFGRLHKNSAFYLRPRLKNFNSKEEVEKRMNPFFSTRNLIVDQHHEILKIFDATNGEKWLNNYGWRTDKPICEWYGVYCEDKCDSSIILENRCPVLYIILDRNGLEGTIPNITLPWLLSLELFNNKIQGTIPNFQMLPNLEYMILYSNQLSGTLPDFNKMEKLRGLWLYGNKIEGPIPDFSGFNQLQEMVMYSNKLSGTIPNFTDLWSLEYFDLGDNLLTGTLVDFNNLKSLLYLVIDSNFLSGPIPDFSNLDNLQEIWLYINHFNGSLPNFRNSVGLECLYLESNDFVGSVPNFSHLKRLRELRLDNNKLIGQTPSFSNSTRLKIISLSENQLDGTLPKLILPRLTNLNLKSNAIGGRFPSDLEIPKVEFLDFSYNHLYGTIPESIVRADNLKFIFLNNNEFEGSMPANFWNLQNLFLIDLSHNCFSGEASNFITPLTDSNDPYQYNYLNLENNKLSGRLDWSLLFVMQIYDLNLKNNLLTGVDELLTKRLWKRLDLSGNPVTSPIPESYSLFSQMDYLGLRNTSAHHQNNSIIPTFAEPTDPYNLRGRFDLFLCPTIRAKTRTATNLIDVDASYYDKLLCQCLPNYFGFAGRCVLCPGDCECKDGLTLSGCHVSPNVVDVTTILICPNSLSCDMQIPNVNWTDTQGPTVEQVCEKGYTGRACSRCEAGYGRQGRGCVKCGRFVVSISLSIGIISIIGFVVYIYKWSSGGSGKFRIVTFHMQTMSILSSVWTTSRGMDSAIEWSYTLGSMQMPNLSCLLDSTNLVDTVMFSVLRIPVVLGISSFFCACFQKRRNKIIHVTINVLILFSYNIARDVFGVFGCTVNDEGENKWYLNIAPWIECGPISAEMGQLMKIAIPTFLTYVIGLPLGLLLALRRRHIDEESSKQRIGFLHQAYKDDCWFWELVIMIRRLLFSFTISIIPYTRPGALFFVLMVLIQGSIWFQHQWQPYNSDFDNKLETVSLYLIFMSFILALLANMFGSEIWMMVLIVVMNLSILLFYVLIGIIFPWIQSRKTTPQIDHGKRSVVLKDVAPCAN